MMINIVSILKSRLVQITLIATLGMGVGAWLNHRLAPPQIITEIVHDTQQVRVEVPVLTERIVTKIVQDPTQQRIINDLIKTNKELSLRVETLTSSTATLQTGGSGGVNQAVPKGEDGSGSSGGTVVEKQPSLGSGVQGKEVDRRSTYTFRDYQLNAEFTEKTFRYTLTQGFRIISTISKDKKGNPVGLIKLYQDTPDGPKEVPTTTQVIFANPDLPRWMTSLRVQGGLGVNQSNTKGGVVAVQWLKRGTTQDPKDLTMALALPMVFITNQATTFGVLPISINLGRIPNQPFSNLWLAPFFDNTKKAGLTLTATF